jgi:hypothetical protein
MSVPSKPQLLAVLEVAEIALSSMIRRWEDGIPAEVRVEIMTEVYEPILRVLIGSRRRGQSLGGGKMLRVPPAWR